MTKRITKIARRVTRAYMEHGDPEGWFPHKYTPWGAGEMLTQRFVPVGGIQVLKHPGTGFQKDPEVNRYEIEMALRESGMYSGTIDKAMDLLPNMDAFYKFLENIGLDKQVQLIKSLLEW